MFYMEEQAESLLLTRLTKSSMTVDPKRSEMLGTYGDMVNFLLRTYAMNEIIAKAYNDPANFRQSSAMTAETYS